MKAKNTFELLKKAISNFRKSGAAKIVVGSYLLAIVGGLGVTLWQNTAAEQALVSQVEVVSEENQALSILARELKELKESDPYAENDELRERQEMMQGVFEEASSLFEQRADLVALGEENEEVELLIARLLSEIGNEEYASASATIEEASREITALFPTPEPVVVQGGGGETSGSSLPGSGYARISVTTSRGSYTVAAVVAPGARVIIETAGNSDCADNCPTKALAEHVAASGGFAGINGAYFCPPDYASCQGKVNSFDTLAVNGRTKAVLNQANNVYSVVPLVTAYGSQLTFYGQTVQWGVDTSSTGALANHPLMLSGGNQAFDESSLLPYQRDTKGIRGFIGKKDGATVIGHVFGATVGDAAEVLRTLGLSEALNLDGGGSSALYFEGGYRVGPGRSLPSAIVLTH